MTSTRGWIPLFLLTLGLTGCAGRRMALPPAIDLNEYTVIGLLTFDCSEPGELGTYTSQRFLQYILTDQVGARVVELGTVQEVLTRVGHEHLDVEAIQAIGEHYRLKTLINGTLEVEDIKPRVNLSTVFSSLSVRAEVEASLTARMLETGTGATIWTASARERHTVGEVTLFSGGEVFFDADDPEKAYGQLVEALVGRITPDFRVQWVRVRKDGTIRY
jgi:nitrogen regulatory protein PII